VRSSGLKTATTHHLSQYGGARFIEFEARAVSHQNANLRRNITKLAEIPEAIQEYGHGAIVGLLCFDHPGKLFFNLSG
jgi:hypothetical protein